MSADGALFRGDAAELANALAAGRLLFHAGAIRGALPQVIDTTR